MWGSARRSEGGEHQTSGYTKKERGAGGDRLRHRRRRRLWLMTEKVSQCSASLPLHPPPPRLAQSVLIQISTVRHIILPPSAAASRHSSAPQLHLAGSCLQQFTCLLIWTLGPRRGSAYFFLAAYGNTETAGAASSLQLFCFWEKGAAVRNVWWSWGAFLALLTWMLSRMDFTYVWLLFAALMLIQQCEGKAIFNMWGWDVCWKQTGQNIRFSSLKRAQKWFLSFVLWTYHMFLQMVTDFSCKTLCVWLFHYAVS